MAAMTKRVNINAPVAIRNITPPIYGTCNNIVMSTGDILKCLCKRAKMEEILPDGSTVVLTMKNYYTDNGAGLDAEKVKPVTAKKEKAKENIKKTEQTATKMTADVFPELTVANDAQVIVEDAPITKSVDNVVEEVSGAVASTAGVVATEGEVYTAEINDNATIEVAESTVDTEEPTVENTEEVADPAAETKTAVKKNSSKKKNSSNK